MKTVRHKGGGGGGAATTREQPTAKRETQTGRAHTESRAAGGQDKQTKHSAKAQGTRGRKPEKAGDNGGAQEEKKNQGTKRKQRKPRDTEGGGGGGGAATSGQPGDTKKAGAQEEPRGEKKKQHRARRAEHNKHKPAPRPGAPRAAKNRKPETRGRTQEEKKNKRKATRNSNSSERGGGGGRPPESGQPPGNTKKMRPHREPRSARPTEQTTQSAKAQGTRGRKPKKARDKGGARKKKKKRNGKKKQSKRGDGRKTKDQDQGKPSLEGAKQSRKTKQPKEKVRRTRTRPAGRPARPGQDGRAHAHTHRTRAWRPPTCKGRCWRPQETAPVHRPIPLSNDRLYGKLDASVTGSTHANHRSARSPRPTPEGPARDNPIAGPRTGTTRSEPRVPASAGASSRHNEPGSRPASACPGSRPVKPGAQAPGVGKGTRAYGKPTRAPRATRPDKARRTTRGHEARQRGTPPATTRAHRQVPSSNGCRVPQTRRARTTRTKPRHRNWCQATPAAVWMDECAPRGYPAPVGYEQPPSGWASERPAATPHTRNTARATQSTAHRATTPVNKSQAAQDTIHATQPTKRAHR